MAGLVRVVLVIEAGRMEGDVKGDNDQKSRSTSTAGSGYWNFKLNYDTTATSSE